MFFDAKARKWFNGCLLIAIILTGVWITSFFCPNYKRATCSVFGLVAASSIFFCGFLPVVKKLPMGLRKRVQGPFDNGHPWVGLLGSWCVGLHTNFTWPGEYWNVHKALFLYFFFIVLTGVIAFFFKHFQIMVKDAKGSEKKLLAGQLMQWGYDVRIIHEALHMPLYLLLFLHVYAYWVYGRFI